MQNYQHQLKVRERKWMGELGLMKTQRIQHEQTVDAAHVSLGNAYAEIQEKYGDLISQARQEQEEKFKEFASTSKAADLAASGRTGRSVQRMGTVELGQYLAQGSRKAYALTMSKRELDKTAAKAAAAARQQQMASFAKVNIHRSPDIAPPPPVMQNVGAAAFMDALSIAGSIAGIATGLGPLFEKTPDNPSDRRLKENIKKIGESLSGLGIYKFNYIGQAEKYIGAMADEVLKIVPEAAILGDDGFYRVNYDLIDVTFKEA